MFKSSENQEAGWQFIKFLCSKQAQDFIGETAFANVIPARRSSGTGQATLADSPEGSNVLYEALEYGTPVPGADQGALVQQTVQDAFTQVLAGNVTAEQAAADANKIIAAALS